jgi:branched-chain amino acid transport system permease protein
MAGPVKVQRHTRASRLALPVGVAAVVAAATVPVWHLSSSSSIMKQGVTFLTLLALAQMWNLLAGYAGLISVGQQAFVGIGAYSLWVFAEKFGVHPLLCVPIAGVIAAVFAVPTAGLAFRLRGGYFAVGTWVIAEVYHLLVTRIGWLGGGSGVGVLSVGGIARSTREAAVFWYALGVAVGSIAITYLLLRSRRGLALTAIRDEETGARGLGVNVLRSKLFVYIVAAFGTGAIGAVIYLNLVMIQPGAAFGLNWSALMIFAVVIGGLGTVEGPIVGAVVYFALQQLLADYGTWYLVLLGALAALIVVFARRGLWGTLARAKALDLFPVRRRLCLETVCFPEDGVPSDSAAGPVSPGGPGGHVADAGSVDAATGSDDTGSVDAGGADVADTTRGTSP